MPSRVGLSGMAERRSLAPGIDLRTIARGVDDRIRPPLQFRDYRLTRSSGGTEDENPWIFTCLLVIHTLRLDNDRCLECDNYRCRALRQGKDFIEYLMEVKI